MNKIYIGINVFLTILMLLYLSCKEPTCLEGCEKLLECNFVEDIDSCSYDCVIKQRKYDLGGGSNYFISQLQCILEHECADVPSCWSEEDEEENDE